MNEEKRSFWDQLVSGSYESEQEQKVLHYVMHRIKEGASLDDVVQEEYVRRNCTRHEVDEIISNPDLVQASRERMEEAFTSDELDPNH